MASRQAARRQGTFLSNQAPDYTKSRELHTTGGWGVVVTGNTYYMFEEISEGSIRHEKMAMIPSAVYTIPQ